MRFVFVHCCRHTNQLDELNIRSATGKLQSCCRLDFWCPVVNCICIFHCCKKLHVETVCQDDSCVHPKLGMLKSLFSDIRFSEAKIRFFSIIVYQPT